MRKTLLGLGLTAMMFLFAPAAQATDGCKVLLCLSNPAGPTAVSQCVPPIEELYDDLFHGRGFPTCNMAGNPQTGQGSWANYAYKPFDDCPAGTTRLEGNFYRVVTLTDGDSGSSYDSPVASSHSEYYDGSPGTRFCGSNVQTFRLNRSHGETEEIQAYKTITEIAANPKPYIADIFINAAFYKQTRF